MDITDEDIHKVIDYLAYKAPDLYANAKEIRVLTESLVKSIKSEIFLKETGTVAEREAEALSNEIYKNAIKDYATAIKNEELIKLRISAANMKIEIWRTLSSNRRAMKV